MQGKNQVRYNGDTDPSMDYANLVWRSYGLVEVRQSSIPGAGNGLFTTASIPSNFVLTGLEGRVSPFNPQTDHVEGSHDAALPREMGKPELVIRGARYSNDMVFATSKDELRLVNGGSIANDAYGTMVYTKRLTHVNNSIRTEVATACVPDGIPNTNSGQKSISERLFLVSTRELAKGEEILSSYGKNYWDQVQSYEGSQNL